MFPGFYHTRRGPCTQKPSSRATLTLNSFRVRSFHFETQQQPDTTLNTVLKQSLRPVVAVPATLPTGQVVVVAYDGSPHTVRALQMFQALGLDDAHAVHVVCVDADKEKAALCVKRAVTFLQGHTVAAQAHTLAISKSPAHVLLQYAQQGQADL